MNGRDKPVAENKIKTTFHYQHNPKKDVAATRLRGKNHWHRVLFLKQGTTSMMKIVFNTIVVSS